jgi:hypothetical protein
MHARWWLRARAGVQFDQNDLAVRLGDIQLMEAGQPLPFDAKAASTYLKDTCSVHGTVKIFVKVGKGSGTGMAWGCDLSYDYVKINAGEGLGLSVKINAGGDACQRRGRAPALRRMALCASKASALGWPARKLERCAAMRVRVRACGCARGRVHDLKNRHCLGAGINISRSWQWGSVQGSGVGGTILVLAAGTVIECGAACVHCGGRRGLLCSSLKGTVVLRVAAAVSGCCCSDARCVQAWTTAAGGSCRNLFIAMS